MYRWQLLLQSVLIACAWCTQAAQEILPAVIICIIIIQVVAVFVMQVVAKLCDRALQELRYRNIWLVMHYLIFELICYWFMGEFVVVVTFTQLLVRPVFFGMWLSIVIPIMVTIISSVKRQNDV